MNTELGTISHRDRRVADRVYHYMTAEFGNASSTDRGGGDR